MDSKELERRVKHPMPDVWLVDKPPGLPTSGKSLEDDDCLQFWLMKHHGAMVWAVHQLDADTSGANLFVLRKELVGFFKREMESPDAGKVYLALVRGVPKWDVQRVDAPIGKVDERSLGVHPDGKHARSHFRVLSRGKDAAWVEVRIETGRTHQIRIHLSHLGHPLLGEEWYGPHAPCDRHPRQALHAWQLNVESFALKIDLPEDLCRLSEREGLKRPG